MPIVNTMAFLFTVLGEWLVEGKVISRGKATNLDPAESAWSYAATFPLQPPVPEAGVRSPLSHLGLVLTSNLDTGVGMLFSLVGIGLCVYSKT